MGKLDTSRMSNATRIGRVDNSHNELENDLGEIFGIPDNTVISTPIFGTTIDGSKPVNADGSIRGIQRLIMDSASSDVDTSVGIEFYDGTERKRIAFVNSGLKIFREGSADWEQVSDLEDPASGSGLLAELSDVDPTLVMAANKVLGTNSLGTLFELQDPASGVGVNRFVDCTDTEAAVGPDPFTGLVDKLVYVKSATSLGFTDQPAGLGGPVVMMLRAPGESVGSSDWNNGSWKNMYNWEFQSFDDDGGFLTDDTNLLGIGPSGEGNFYIELDAGVYEINYWFTTVDPTAWGVREWRVQGSNSDGPATYGATQRAKCVFSNAGDLIPEGGLQYLGSKLLIQLDTDDVYFQCRQTSGRTMSGCSWFVTIHQVK